MLEGKFKCVKEVYPQFMKKGNVYAFKDGQFKEESGIASCQFESLESFNNNCNTKIIPYIENFTKSDLKDGDYIIDRNGCAYIVSIKFNKFIDKDKSHMLINSYNANLSLINADFKEFDIMKVERNGEIIWEREEKSEREILIDKLQSQMDEIKKKIDNLRE